MKRIKGLVSVIIIVCLLICCAPSAFAVAPQFNITKEILNIFDEKEFAYSLLGITSNEKDEHISISFSGDYLDSIDVDIYVRDSISRIQLSCFDFMEYSADDFNKVLRAVNKANLDFTCVKFYCDESTNAVSAEFDGYVEEGAAGDIVYEMLSDLVFIVDEVYNDSLSVYKK